MRREKLLSSITLYCLSHSNLANVWILESDGLGHKCSWLTKSIQRGILQKRRLFSKEMVLSWTWRTDAIGDGHWIIIAKASEWMMCKEYWGGLHSRQCCVDVWRVCNGMAHSGSEESLGGDINHDSFPHGAKDRMINFSYEIVRRIWLPQKLRDRLRVMNDSTCSF